MPTIRCGWRSSPSWTYQRPNRRCFDAYTWPTQSSEGGLGQKRNRITAILQGKIPKNIRKVHPWARRNEFECWSQGRFFKFEKGQETAIWQTIEKWDDFIESKLIKIKNLINLWLESKNQYYKCDEECESHSPSTSRESDVASSFSRWFEWANNGFIPSLRLKSQWKNWLRNYRIVIKSQMVEFLSNTLERWWSSQKFKQSYQYRKIQIK